MYLLLWDITVWLSQLQSGGCKFHRLEHWGATKTRQKKKKKSLCVEIKTAHHQRALNILSVLHEDNLCNIQKRPGFYLHTQVPICRLFLTDDVNVPAGSGYKLMNTCIIWMQQCLCEVYNVIFSWGICLWGYCSGAQYILSIFHQVQTLHKP